MKDLNSYIKKSHLTAVQKFNNELREWSLYCNGNPDDDVELYEDINTVFRLSNVRVEDGCLCYRFDGAEERENMLRVEDDGTVWEPDGLDSIPEYLKFWRSCLRRAKRYWEMDCETLDRLAESEEYDDDEEE